MTQNYNAGNAGKTSLIKKTMTFLSEVKKEISQVIWPGRKETSLTTVIVCIFAFVMSIYLFAVDQTLLKIIQWIMK